MFLRRPPTLSVTIHTMFRIRRFSHPRLYYRPVYYIAYMTVRRDSKQHMSIIIFCVRPVGNNLSRPFIHTFLQPRSYCWHLLRSLPRNKEYNKNVSAPNVDTMCGSLGRMRHHIPSDQTYDSSQIRVHYTDFTSLQLL